MYPSDLTFYGHTRSEEIFYKALKDQLPNYVSIFYSVVWYQNVEGVRHNSEIDFVIFDPNFGYLAIEVKGGKKLLKVGDEWRLIDGVSNQDNYEDTEREKVKYRVLKRSPFTQAANGMRFLKKYFEDTYNQRFPGIYGYACAFPFYRIEMDFGPEGSRDLIIDFEDMGNLTERINRLFHYWKGQNRNFIFVPLDIREKFINLIHRRMAVAEIIGSTILEQERKLAMINRIQDNYLELLSNYQKAFIIGGAGTGKTYLALKKAIQLARKGDEVLLLCYNTSLAEFLEKKLADYEKIDVFTFWSLIRKSLGADVFNRLTISNPDLNGVFDLIDSQPGIKKYDAIIVDEAQDFSEEWALCVRLFMKDEVKNTLYVFYDEEQNIFSRCFKDSFAINLPPYILFENLRNTSEIHKWAVKTTGLGKNSRSNNISGVKPQKFSFTRAREARAKLGSLLNDLVLKEKVPNSSIVVLSNRTLENSFLKGNPESGAMKLVDNNKEITDNEIEYKTVQGFKGLEADIIIFLQHISGENVNNKLLYVAYTRAKFMLFIIEYRE